MSWECSWKIMLVQSPGTLSKYFVHLGLSCHSNGCSLDIQPSLQLCGASSFCPFHLFSIDARRHPLNSPTPIEHSLVPRLLFTEWENSLVNCLYCLGSNIFEVTVTSRQLDCKFKSALVNSKLLDSLLMLLSIDTIA